MFKAKSSSSSLASLSGILSVGTELWVCPCGAAVAVESPWGAVAVETAGFFPFKEEEGGKEELGKEELEEEEVVEEEAKEGAGIGILEVILIIALSM